MKKWLVVGLSRLFVFIILLAFIVGIASIGAYSKYQAALGLTAKPIASSLGADHTFVFEKGSSLDDLLSVIASQQPELDQLDQRLIQFFSRFNGQAMRLKAGRYAWYDDNNATVYTIRDVIDHIVSGDTKASSLTIPEGITIAEFRQRVYERSDIQHITRDLSDEAFIALFSDEYEHPEGLFLADTYFYDFDSTDKALFQRAYDELQQVLGEVWAQRDESIDLTTPYEALIMASLIEKETALDAERGEISGVFHRRLHKGMRLQTDPAVIYGLGDDYQGKLFKSDLKNDTPYNTYRRHGLTPTPIAVVGRDSLVAAVNPEAGESLYFVADGQGGHRFAKTLEEHNANVRTYRAAVKQ